MKVYLNTYLISLVVGLIAKTEKISEQDAVLAFYNTKLALNFDEEDNILKGMSPYFVFELWKSEKETGSYLNSQYISALI
jgi:hypothetical protein